MPTDTKVMYRIMRYSGTEEWLERTRHKGLQDYWTSPGGKPEIVSLWLSAEEAASAITPEAWARLIGRVTDAS